MSSGPLLSCLGAVLGSLLCSFVCPQCWQLTNWLTISNWLCSKVKVTLRLMVSQSVSLGIEPHLGLVTRYLLLFDSYGLVSCGAPSLTRGRVCLLYMLLALASAAFLRSEFESESHVTIDGQSASLSWYKAPIWGLDQIFIAVRNTEYVGHLRVCWYGALSLTRGLGVRVSK
jgi:hypothetical protein